MDVIVLHMSSLKRQVYWKCLKMALRNNNTKLTLTIIEIKWEYS